MSSTNSSKLRPCESFFTNFVNELNSDDRSRVCNTFSSLSKCINENYTVKSGKMNLYHGNVYNYGNREVHQLYKPDSIFNQRMWDLVDSHTNPKLQTKNKISTVQASYTDKDLQIKFSEHWRNAPIEWSFNLQNK